MKLYLDLDGVLADFDKGYFNYTGTKASRKFIMWGKLASHPNFYGTLPIMEDAMELFEFCKPYNPTILTGIPIGKWAAGQKKVWCGENLGWDIPVITCFARDKHKYCQPGDILVDDYTKTKSEWESAKGIFILHTSAKSSIEQLKFILEEK